MKEYTPPCTLILEIESEGVFCASQPFEYLDNGGLLFDNDWGEF